MNRFHTVTVLFALSALGAGLSLEGPERTLVLVGLAATYLALFALGVSVLKLNFFLTAVCRGDSTLRQVTLTFDDGPDPLCTPALLRVLRNLGVKAAFFPVGAKIREHPGLIRKIDREGHVLGNHSFRHAWWTNFLVSRALDREIQDAQGAFSEVIGKTPAYFRPPMGLTNPHLGKKLREHGLTAIGWDIRPFDTRRSADKVVAKVLGKIRNGSIVLLHETGRSETDLSRLVQDLVAGLKERGYVLVGLEDLVNADPYQPAGRRTLNESDLFLETWFGGGPRREGGGFRMFLARKMAASPYVRKALQERANLEAFKSRPTPRFLWGVGFVLFSYILGWPMVGMFSFLAAYLRTPALLMVGPVSYGVSHFVFLFGMFLAGRDCLRYANLGLSWGMRRVAERILPRRNP
jgi:peptidoglycan/xylan/chitin deacetylase (PgdA/CDA1 family)